ncbi:notchless-like protein [Brachionus plicatilis]|uniref:Notchless-like protein n=1 Tax=Brachionus plicatilis TaxID=10195 RepID=A0A3M7PWR1_BRAPC|nr:notchless-like protein [Brachionus plicatilis]
MSRQILCQFKDDSGQLLGAPIDLPIDIDKPALEKLCQALISSEKQEEIEDDVPYLFYVNESEVSTNLEESLKNENNFEKVTEIIYQPQAIFKVRSVTRCSSTIEGHTEAVISVAFSPDGKQLASGSGDTTVRFWDLTTETPLYQCSGHKNWVLCVAWSPDGQKLASADKNSNIMIWNPETGKQFGKTLCQHRQWITYLCWKPFHLDEECRYLASSSKDSTIKIWDTIMSTCIRSLSSHTQSVTCVKWGGKGLLYSSSQDRTIKVWRADDGVMCRNLDGHGHWVNTLALNSDYILRTGAFDPKDATLIRTNSNMPRAELKEKALKRYKKYFDVETEKLVSGSDDFTMILWNPEVDKKNICRMTGHQQLINDVRFSPDTRLIASASFDKSIKLWDGKTGKFIATLRGHVQSVYQISFSSDSRLLVSGSADSTLKVWDLKNKKLHMDLPGHADEVYAVDWSPDGQMVASGGKDRVLKM